MSILQDPLAALNQVEWYLTNTQHELFPGAFELAAGNLCRQTIEQALFLLCFFSGMPRDRYIKPSRQLQTAGRMLKALNRIDPPLRHRYWHQARQRGPRIAKMARQPRSTEKWVRLLNEPSHFSAPNRIVGKPELREFAATARGWFDVKDHILILAALNEIFSGGRFRAMLGPDANNTPDIRERIQVTSRNLERDEQGHLALATPTRNWVVVSGREVPRGPWPQSLVVIEHTTGFRVSAQFVTKQGKPIDCTNMSTVLGSLGFTRGHRAAVTKRVRQLGFAVDWSVRAPR